MKLISRNDPWFCGIDVAASAERMVDHAPTYTHAHRHPLQSRPYVIALRSPGISIFCAER
jgi:hypothetical protein